MKPEEKSLSSTIIVLCVKCFNGQMVLIAEKSGSIQSGSFTTMTFFCCWSKQGQALEEVEEEQLRESKMGLKPKPFKTIG